MCDDRNLYCYHGRHYHDKHHHHDHWKHKPWKYSTIAKKTGKPAIIPEILFEVADIEDGDFFKIYIRKIKK
ncbi:hypothetical protein [Methanobacterium ferruginis]|uniref:hypothetical protein n=1 Tax=Methanobacterium ferruginis TaxID=710191 RepID=UPI0025730512|nr:hypothetical protein [Methanobacterium ferruginis]BDZ68825.1 hypothetical protein GCM10025860_22730 [Methanobacterium ferruginis]